ncbi:MAG: helix-turn-helix transcriptional regulator [Rubrivivax sp.]|nr:helix-turn-helix transcriptional regulator [Rubrivivax sp.]
MATPASLGHLEQLVLLAVLHLGEGAYALAVRDQIAARTQGDPSRGAVSVTLDRLERKGLLQSRLGEPTAERGGKAKRLYTLAAPGRLALQHTLRGTQAMLQGLPPDWAAPPRR